MPYAEVIGDPIAHSKSPLIHKFWLRECGIEGDYRATRMTVGELEAYFEDRRTDPNWRGCNVTSPLKEAVLQHSCMPDDFVGAANVLTPLEDRELLPGNTDYLAIHALLEAAGVAGKEAVVIGAGGAARAALAALRSLEASRVTLLCRSTAKGEKLLDHFGLPGTAVLMDTRLPEAALLINASPLGMIGAAPLEIILDPLPEDAVILDAVYKPLKTDLLAHAEERGLRTIDGLQLLIEQAEHSFALFFNAHAPRDLDAGLRELLLR